MTKREFVSIALKLMAVYTAILATNNGILSIGQFIAVSNSNILSAMIIPSQAQYMVFLPVLAQVGMVIFLWLFADALAISIVREDGALAGGVSSSEAKSVAFSVVGVWLAVAGLVDFIRQYSHRSFVVNTPFNDAGFTSSLIASTLQFIIGVALMYGARNLVRVLTSPRDWGRDASFDDKNNESQTSSQ